MKRRLSPSKKLKSRAILVTSLGLLVVGLVIVASSMAVGSIFKEANPYSSSMKWQGPTPIAAPIGIGSVILGSNPNCQKNPANGVALGVGPEQNALGTVQLYLNDQPAIFGATGYGFTAFGTVTALDGGKVTGCEYFEEGTQIELIYQPFGLPAGTSTNYTVKKDPEFGLPKAINIITIGWPNGEATITVRVKSPHQMVIDQRSVQSRVVQPPHSFVWLLDAVKATPGGNSGVVMINVPANTAYKDYINAYGRTACQEPLPAQPYPYIVAWLGGMSDQMHAFLHPESECAGPTRLDEPWFRFTGDNREIYRGSR